VGNILILHSGLSGITNASLEIANRLKTAQHIVYTGSIQDNQAKITSYSFDYVQINPIRFEYRNISKNDPLVANKAAFGSNKEAFQAIYHELDFPSFDEVLSNKKIDLLLIDMELHEYIIYAHTRGIPVVLISQWFSSWRAPNSLPLSSTDIPSSRLQQKYQWNRSQLIGRLKTVLKSIQTVGFNRRNFILYLSNKLGFDISELQSYQFPFPFTYKTLPIISTTHPDLEFNKDSRVNLFYTYPMVFDQRNEYDTDRFTTDFKKIIRQKHETNKKLVVMTQTTMKGKSVHHISKLIKALSQLEDCISIVAVGSFYEKYKNTWSATNVFIYPAIPLSKAFRHADLSINHGGIHTINECIHYKIPMLVLSGNQFDQNGCSARIAHHGCGLARDIRKISVTEITSTIHQVLSVPTFKKKIEQLYTSYQKAKSSKLLEHYIDTMLSK
jgi:UDP:flavonoid glycosyltransferase YjiC (YdhE family)